ncbi:hypothetical protein GCM10019017_02660 [Streptomyces showdoensis]
MSPQRGIQDPLLHEIFHTLAYSTVNIFTDCGVPDPSGAREDDPTSSSISHPARRTSSRRDRVTFKAHGSLGGAPVAASANPPWAEAASHCLDQSFDTPRK